MFRLVQFGTVLSKLRHCGLPIGQAVSLATAPRATRSLMSRTSKVVETRLKVTDQIPENFQIVYRGGMDKYVNLAHTSSAVFIFFGIGTIYRTFYIEDEPIQFPIELPFKLVGITNYTEVAIMYGVFFFMMVVLRQISTRYVLRMYYNPETQIYRAIRLGILPTATRSYDFPAGTLTRQPSISHAPWRIGVYKSNATKLLFFEPGFKTSADFNRLFKD